nr:hypothetical protein [Erwinia sp. Ejp617]
MDKLEGHIGLLQTDVGVLKTDVGMLKMDVGMLKVDVDRLKEDVGRLKDDVGILKIDVGVIKSNYATKEDVFRLDSKMESLLSELHQSLAAQIKWFATSQLGLLALGLGLAKLFF